MVDRSDLDIIIMLTTGLHSRSICEVHAGCNEKGWMVRFYVHAVC